MSSGRLTSYEVGDVVYLQKHFVNEKAHKIKHPYAGPFRVKDVAGNTVELVNLSSGKTKRASMRQLKLFKAESLTRSCNPNIDRVFPSEKHTDIDLNNDNPVGVTEGELVATPPSELLPVERTEPKPATGRYNLRSSKKPT